MSSANATSEAPRTERVPTAAQILAISDADVLKPDSERKRERFIPVTVNALIDRLTVANAWQPNEAQAARRFFRYLEYWRRQRYGASLIELLQDYEPFSPDSDLLITRTYSPDERANLQKRVVRDVAAILEQANYVHIDPKRVELILTKESHYGLDLFVDFGEFEECLIYYRGASTRRDQRRVLRRFMRKEEFDVPIFQRLFLLFKLKPLEQRVLELMRDRDLERHAAEKLARRLRALLPASVREDSIYLKLFKNIPRNDIEMVFPNTQVRFRLKDKLKLGVTASGGLGMGVVGAAGKLALFASNPVMALGAVAGLGTVAFRQGMNFVNQKQRYMVVMAQNLYFHSMADNRGVLLKLADRAAEEDVKEEILLYCVLVKELAKNFDLPLIDKAIETYLTTNFGVTVDFDLEDALHRLKADGIVSETPDGRLVALPPTEAAQHIDSCWDRLLDDLPDTGRSAGRELNGHKGGQAV